MTISAKNREIGFWVERNLLPFEQGKTWSYTGGPHPSFDGNGLQPGVDLHNNAALLALMEEYDATTRR